MVLHPDFREFVALCNAKGVRYLLVGGYALGLHGRPRYTGDMDLWIAIDNENAKLVLACLQDFGFGSLGITQTDLMQPNQVIQLGYEPVLIDILTSLDGVDFESCYTSKIVADIGGTPCNIIGKQDLIANKGATNRPIDQDDIARLNS